MKTLEVLLLLSISVSLTCAGLGVGSGGGHKQYGPPPSPLKHHHKSSGSGGHNGHIKGGIGDGYIYPVKTYKIVVQNSAASHHAAAQSQSGHVKTFKVITENHAASSKPAHSPPVKTLKLIHVKGGSSDCPSNGHGWQ